MLATGQRQPNRSTKRTNASTPFAKAYEPLIRHLTPSQLMVWLGIKMHDRQDKCEAYPGQETIAKETGLGLRTVRDVTRELHEIGALRREPRGRNRYRYLFFDIPKDWTPRGAAPADSAALVEAATGRSCRADRQILPDRPADFAAEVDKEKKNKHEKDGLDWTSACGDSTKCVQEQRCSDRQPGEDRPLDFSVDYDQPLAYKERERQSLALVDHLDRLRTSTLDKPPMTETQRRHNLKSARLLVDNDGRTAAEITGMITWAIKDVHWSSRVSSLYTLRTNYLELLRESSTRRPRAPCTTVPHGQLMTPKSERVTDPDAFWTKSAESARASGFTVLDGI